MLMHNNLTKIGICEHRLIHERDISQLGRDIYGQHMKGRVGFDKPIETVGAVVMPVVAAVSNGIGAAIRSVTSDSPPVALGDGPLKYTEQGGKLVLADAGALLDSAVHLRPIKTLGNALNLGLGVVDLATRPFIDVTSDALGHISRNGGFSRAAMQKTLARSGETSFAQVA